MKSVHLIDGNNELRRRFEVSASAIRDVIGQALWTFDTLIWVWDGYNAKAKRRALFPEYKANRKGAPDDFYKTVDLAKEVLAHTKAIQISVPGYEADDVIATLVRGSPDTTFHITSTDKDFAALARHNVYTDKKLEGVTPELVRLSKTLVGDPSDNVKGIPRFGAVGFNSIDKQAWTSALNSETLHPNCQIGLSDKLWQWVQENFHQLVVYWKVVDFLTVPNEEITKNMVVGKVDTQMIEDLLGPYRL